MKILGMFFAYIVWVPIDSRENKLAQNLIKMNGDNDEKVFYSVGFDGSSR